MSFSSDVKLEITQKKLPKPEAAKAACYAVACFGKNFDAYSVSMQTEQEAIAKHLLKLFARCGIDGEIKTQQRPSGAFYEFCVVSPDQVQKMHALFGTTGRETSLQINPSLIASVDAVQAFVAAAFLCAGTITDPEKEYNLEFNTPRFNLSKDFEALLAQYEFKPHRTQRKGSNVIYIKASEKVADLLTFMRANNASMEIMNRKVYKSIRNKTNRLTNCDTANLGKTAAANALTIKAIRTIEEFTAFDALPQQLQEAAQKRLAHPDMPLAKLAETFTPPLSKSGLSHRMKKIEAIAADLQQKQAQAAQGVAAQNQENAV
ncbi:MAG: DNA-binding protein WhiA [Faecalibacterium sp.]